MGFLGLGLRLTLDKFLGSYILYLKMSLGLVQKKKKMSLGWDEKIGYGKRGERKVETKLILLLFH